MTTGGDQHLITLLTKPMDRDGGSAEEVTLAVLPTGELTLHSHASGRTVELVMGDGVTEYHRRWTVAAGHVEQVSRACARELFPDTTALSGWLARTGVPAAPGEWYGFTLRPLDDRRFVLAAVRTVLGVTDDDEGTTVADRFLTWLTGHGIGYTTWTSR